VGRIDGYTLESGPAGHHLAAPQGIESDWLLHETTRRMRALGSLQYSLSPFRDRPTLTTKGAAQLGGSTTEERRETLQRANGRRSSRDVAFLLGRSLYAVTVELSRMLGEGLVEVVPACTGGTGARHSAAADRSRESTAFPFRSPGVPELPQRERGSSGINDVLPLRPVSGDRDHCRPSRSGSRAAGRSL
jgi:hypothetical protein